VAERARVIVVFEGRDTAGRGGVIKWITERCSPRVFRHVALPAPSDREKSQLYIQRYMTHFLAAGEIILFDRSWYNRAGVERVMGFCSDEQYEHFLKLAPAVEREIVDNGIILLKYFLDVSQDEQRRRFEARIADPIKHWKLSPMDVESVRRWWDYTKAYRAMIVATDSRAAPWYIVPADDKRRARLTPDGRPVIDRVAAPDNVVVATLSSVGFGLSPASGRAIADLVTHGSCSFADLSPFTLSRFAGLGPEWRQRRGWTGAAALPEGKAA
jgi:polyphosphate kinase 2